MQENAVDGWEQAVTSFTFETNASSENGHVKKRIIKTASHHFNM